MPSLITSLTTFLFFALFGAIAVASIDRAIFEPLTLLVCAAVFGWEWKLRSHCGDSQSEAEIYEQDRDAKLDDRSKNSMPSLIAVLKNISTDIRTSFGSSSIQLKQGFQCPSYFA